MNRTEELLDALQREVSTPRAMQQLLPIELPEPAPAPPPAHSVIRANIIAILEGALEDTLVALDFIADDRRRLCRCLNKASCLCWAPKIAREYQGMADSARIAIRRAIKPPG